tara:strand:- start:27 stop:1073 length:1047 start_codon:yes stop_codon:yes gene_type:complete
MVRKKFIFKYSLLFIIFTISILITISLQATNVKNSAVVYMYHKFGVSKYPSTNITIEQLKSHLTELSKPKYNVKKIENIVDTIINDGQLPNNTVGISIDDADRSFLEIGWPLFKKFNFPVVLFISTNSISYSNKNYLNWDEIRQLKNEGVDIGSHLHSHSHFTDLTKEDLIKEIETSNKIFLKELDSIPTLFAYPYGETDEAFMDVLKDYKFKVAFGQHSGVINETSNMYYLPRFSLNEKYGDLERLQFTANTKGLGVYDFIPTDPIIFNNPPYIGFSLLDDSLSKTINCFIFDSKGTTESDLFKFNERIEIRLKRKLNKGRARLNCTAIDQKKQWRWFGHQFYIEDK